MSDYRDDLAAAHARNDALEAELAAVKSRDTDPDPMIPVVHDPAEVFANESFRDRLDDWNDRNGWFKWSALVVAIVVLAGSAIKWCNG